MIVLLLILLGLCLGSFVNAFVWRLHEGKDWVKGRSECPECHHELAPKDLVPVASWLWLRGKCRYCGKAIADSPLVELAVPGLFVLSYFFWPMELTGEGLFLFGLWLVFIVGFVALALYDIRWFLLPDKIVFPLLGLAIFQVLALPILFDASWTGLLGSAVGALVLSGFFLVLYLVSNGRWIGFGDVKLGIVLGLLAGGAFEAMLLLLLASVLGMCIALPLLMTGKARRGSHLPFGPLLLAATVVVVLWGSAVIDWYTSQLFF